MRINFEQAQHIVDFMELAYEQLAVPYYVTYDYLSDTLQSTDKLNSQLDQLQCSGSFVRPLYDRLHSLENDVIDEQYAIDNYEKFKTYYEKAKELQSFEIK